MLGLDQIKKFYSDELYGYPEFMLKEYLQYKILEIIYDSPFSSSLCFMGGTCLRIVYENSRFSEDLDFDNLSLNEQEFDELANEIGQKMRLLGYDIEINSVYKGAWHCYIKFPGLLYDEGLSGYKEQKILIQLDTESQNFEYNPDRYILNRFDVFTPILSTPLDILMAQKLFAILNRKRNKGRDFYDVVFLMSKQVKPNYAYLEAKVGVSNPAKLKRILQDKIHELNMDTMAKDVEPFLFNPTDIKKVIHFDDLVKQYFV